jgi:G3E family GTPase
VRNDLTALIGKLASRPDPPDHILVETSGMADPMPATQALFVDDVAEAVALDAIITLVDAAHIEEHLDEAGPGSVDGLAVDQIVCADKIVLNKIDLVDDGRLAYTEARLRGLNNQADVVRATFAAVDLDDVLGIGAFDRSRRASVDDDFFEQGHVFDADPELESVSIEIEGELDGDRVRAWLKSLVEERARDLYRVKGILAVAGEEARMILQGVHSIAELYPDVPWEGARRSRVVAIGRDLDAALLRAGLEDCVVS